MAEGEDQDQKTEDPTQKRLQEAFEKGQIPYSKEISNFLILSVLALTVGAFAPSILQNTKSLLLPFLADADSIQTDPASLALAMNHVILGTMSVIAIPVMLAFAAGVLARFLQSGFVISTDPIAPKLSKISPLAGFKRIFSLQSVVEFIKTLLKFIIVGVVGYLSVASDLGHLKQLPDSTILAMLLYMGELAIKLLIGTLIAIFFIALIDLLYQRFQFTKNLRMSKQEIKDEYKQSEGDPMIKQRLRQLRMERAKQRMMSAVPQSDVVITNPTHYAVALQYDNKEMKAPVIMAMGQDLLALRMREIAEEHEIPIVENPPLARALFASGELNKEIPIIHYEAVAKVISYVYQLKGKKI
ncbi:MAG: flagellar biosynthesis protein FlhB [Rickettsiales bacterium]|jgi:flagellar biosynthetic protein FlhB|nr:flagellar biosynthesis protein FlhB [Rickettsiales bacterium]